MSNVSHVLLVRPIYHSNLLHTLHSNPSYTLHSNQFQFKYKPPSAEALGGNKYFRKSENKWKLITKPYSVVASPNWILMQSTGTLVCSSRPIFIHGNERTNKQAILMAKSTIKKKLMLSNFSFFQLNLSFILRSSSQTRGRVVCDLLLLWIQVKVVLYKYKCNCLCKDK